MANLVNLCLDLLSISKNSVLNVIIAILPLWLQCIAFELKHSEKTKWL